MSKNRNAFPYRLRYVDRYHTLPDMDILVSAHNVERGSEK